MPPGWAVAPDHTAFASIKSYIGNLPSSGMARRSWTLDNHTDVNVCGVRFLKCRNAGITMIRFTVPDSAISYLDSSGSGRLEYVSLWYFSRWAYSLPIIPARRALYVPWYQAPLDILSVTNLGFAVRAVNGATGPNASAIMDSGCPHAANVSPTGADTDRESISLGLVRASLWIAGRVTVRRRPDVDVLG